MNSVKCPIAPRFCGGFLEFTSVAGKLVESCPRCDRRRAGICRDCPSPVEGYVGKAIRCASCKKRRRRENEHHFMRDPDNRARKNRRYRKRWHTNAEFRERRRSYKVAWRAAHPDRVKRWKRAYLLKQPKAYLAYHRRRNADPVHRAKNRALSREKYYEKHPVRPDPHCSGCEVRIEWSGKGRPRATCDRCCTPSELRRRQEGYNATAHRKRKAAA